MSWDNPYDIPFDNPRRRRRKVRRNPFGGATKTLGGFTQGIGLVDIASAIAGLAAANALPSTLMPKSGKLLKVIVAVAAAFGMGYLLRSVAGERAGKMAVAGGLAGATVTGLSGLGLKIPGLSGPSFTPTSGILPMPAIIGGPQPTSSVGSESAIITNIT